MDEIFRVILNQHQSDPSEPRAVKPQKPPKSMPVRILISLAVTLVFAAVYFYISLPALNIHAPEFYWFFFLILAVFSVCMMILGGFRAASPGEYIGYLRKNLKIPFFLICLLIAVVVIGSVSGMVIFRTKAYSSLLQLETGNFTEEVAEINYNQIPMLDSQSANNLSNRKLGELSDLVSQFTVNPESAQINYNDVPVRVSYLDYDNLFKWLSNRSEGIPAYLYVNMVTQEVTVQRLEEGIKISPSEYFNRDLQRYLRFRYPTKMFTDVNFEIDEEGTPYWIGSVTTRTIGLFGGRDVIGAVLLNAVTGESTYYDIDDVPQWVDRVFLAELVIEQYDYRGRYHNGFFNAIFGQENCTETTDGYNYIALDDDVWVYTGVTSVSGDLGNIGFILVNQRTKEGSYYSCAGAEEYSAMSSAQGAVQQYDYQATFPLLLNISDQPTYFMALKDAAGLVKMYAMVNVQQYQIVATGTSVATCEESYRRLLAESNLIDDSDVSIDSNLNYQQVDGAIAEIREATMNGNTQYFIRLIGESVYYQISAASAPLTVILNVGDEVTIEFLSADGEIIAANAVTRK